VHLLASPDMDATERSYSLPAEQAVAAGDSEMPLDLEGLSGAIAVSCSAGTVEVTALVELAKRAIGSVARWCSLTAGLSGTLLKLLVHWRHSR
jgi:hypothetical protein